MTTFEFWYSETYTFKGFFEADSQAEADEMLEDVREGRGLMGDILPNFSYGDKGYEIELDNAKEII